MICDFSAVDHKPVAKGRENNRYIFDFSVRQFSTPKPFYYAQFSCQTLYSTLSSAKAEVLQLQNTDKRYKEEHRQMFSNTNL